jgi:hypothetical protein
MTPGPPPAPPRPPGPPPAPSRPAVIRGGAPRPVSPEDVLAAVVELCGRYHAPSTSLITARLAPEGRVTGVFQSAVKEALEQLYAGGRLLCVVHRGTDRWSPVDRALP